MVPWMVAFVLWASGDSLVPAFGPWCDYSQRTDVQRERVDPRSIGLPPPAVSYERGLDDETVWDDVTAWYVYAKTDWAPPQWQCVDWYSSDPWPSTYSPHELAQHEHGGPISEPIAGREPLQWALQLMVLLLPPLSWWLTTGSFSKIAARRQIAAVLFVAGVLSIGWGIVSVIGASLHYGQLFLGIGIALATFGFVYRRRRPAPAPGMTPAVPPRDAA